MLYLPPRPPTRRRLRVGALIGAAALIGIACLLFRSSGASPHSPEGAERRPETQTAIPPPKPPCATIDESPDKCSAVLRLSGEENGTLPLTKAQTHKQGNRMLLKVNGKSIGYYLDPLESSVRRVRENAHLYRPPVWFATLTPETIKLQLGEGLDLGQFVAFKDYHGADGKKVYTTERHTDLLALRPELIDKLIKLRQRLREKGVKLTRFWITSGFRTPDYNRSIGGAAYSRHCYGDAADLCIDEDNDKRMDDLNGDGKLDRKDGIVIGNACRELEAEGAVVSGGIGVYEWDSDDSVRSHVHIDCRGYVSRWGQNGAGRYKKSFVWWPRAEFQEEDSGE
jgi:hypothetical protein